MELKISDLPPQFENIAIEIGIDTGSLSPQGLSRDYTGYCFVYDRRKNRC